MVISPHKVVTNLHGVDVLNSKRGIKKIFASPPSVLHSSGVKPLNGKLPKNKTRPLKLQVKSPIKGRGSLSLQLLYVGFFFHIGNEENEVKQRRWGLGFYYLDYKL